MISFNYSTACQVILNNGGMWKEDVTSLGPVLPAAGSPAARLHVCRCNGCCSFSIWVDLWDEEATYHPLHSRQRKASWEKHTTEKQRNTQQQHQRWDVLRGGERVIPAPGQKEWWRNGLRKLVWWNKGDFNNKSFTQRMQTSICDRGNFFYTEGQLGLEESLRLLQAMRRVACNIERKRHVEKVHNAHLMKLWKV